MLETSDAGGEAGGEPGTLARARFVAASFYAVASSPAMPGWPEYRARVERERSQTPGSSGGSRASGVTCEALAEIVGARALHPRGRADRIVGSLVSFADDHREPLPLCGYPATDAARLIDRLRGRAPHSLAPASLLGLALEATDDAWHALVVCHLATRQLARGRDTRAFDSRAMSIAERCDAGLAIAPFPASIARGGDPLGDTYHYFANVIAGVLSASGRVGRLGGLAIAGLFYAGPVLMRLVRERAFGSELFYGAHEHVDRLGLTHGLALGRRQPLQAPSASSAS